MQISPSMEKGFKKLTSFAIWVQPLKYMDHLKRTSEADCSCYICDGTVIYYMEQQTNFFQIKHNLYRSLVLSILTYGCETWTINAAMEKKMQAFENKSYRKLLGITYQEIKTNVFVHNRIIEIIGNFEPLLKTIKQSKLNWFGHISRHDNLCKTIMQGAVEGSRIRVRPKQKCIDNIFKWTKKDVNCLIKHVHETTGEIVLLWRH